MSSFVNTLIQSGLDAFTNLYDIEFQLPDNVTSLLQANGKLDITNEKPLPDAMKLRVGDFQGPQPKLAQYTTDYQTIQITRVAPMMEFERKFDLTFRIDTNYLVFHALKQWSFLYHDALNGGVKLPKGTETSILGTIIVSAYTPNTGTTAITWGYNGVACLKVTDPAFARAGTEPATCTASFTFFDYLPPGLDKGVQLSGSLLTE